MSDNDSFLLGQIDGKLDMLMEKLTEHAAEDARRFTALGQRIESHAADINKAKGAKGALLTIAGVLGGGVAWVAGRIFGAH